MINDWFDGHAALIATVAVILAAIMTWFVVWL